MSAIEPMYFFPVLESLLGLGLTVEAMEQFIASKRPAAGIEPAVPTKPVLWERVDATTIQVNLDFLPNLPFDDAKRAWRRGKKGRVTVELKDGELYVDGRKVALHLEPEQQGGGSLEGSNLRKRLVRKQVLHPNVMDAIVEADLVPNSWELDEQGRTRYIYFWAQGFRGSDGHLCVRCAFWYDGQWQRGYGNLVDRWSVLSPTAVAS